MGVFKDLSGEVFNNLTVLSISHKTSQGYFWNCKCSCGKTCSVLGQKLKNGHTKSCGCLFKKWCSEGQKKHGMSYSPEYESWLGIKRRCFDENDSHYKYYGGSGITMFDGWANSFSDFISYVGKKPDYKNSWSIGRIDNLSGYFPGNVRWETVEEQARNHRRQVNNKTGFSGIQFKMDAYGAYYIARVSSYGFEKKRIQKSFSFNKLGEERALEMAIAWRKDRLLEMEELGTFYAKTHGIGCVSDNLGAQDGN